MTMGTRHRFNGTVVGAAVLAASMSGAGNAAAQAHGPASGSPAHAPVAPARGTPTAAAGHGPAAKPSPGKPAPPGPPPVAGGADDHSKMAPRTNTPATRHTDDDVEHAPPQAPAEAPAPRGRAAASAAGNRELDAVMQRINSRISATAGKPTPPRPSGSTASPTPGAMTAGARGAGRPAPGHVEAQPVVRSASAPRVTLTWRPTVVWPRTVLDGGDSRVDVAWTAAVQ